MASNLPLKTMSVEEKLQAMESLWDDLCANAESMASPAWHEDVLAERDAARERGDDESEDWEAAKKNIRNKVS
jgi:hypothetical protein